jgi:hypothetical protein
MVQRRLDDVAVDQVFWTEGTAAPYTVTGADLTRLLQ